MASTHAVPARARRWIVLPPTLVTISDKVNGTGRTMYAMLADDDEGFDEEKAGTYSVTLNCTDRKKI